MKPRVAQNSQPNLAALTECNIHSMICEEIVRLFERYNFEYEYSHSHMNCQDFIELVERAAATLLPIRYQNCTSIMRQMPERKLLDQVSDVARLRHWSLRTEETGPQLD